jgi:hypothetical protein
MLTQQPTRLGFDGATVLEHALPSSPSETERQEHVVEDRQVGQEVEHLEDDAEVLDPEAIARRRRQSREVGTENADGAFARGEHAAQQAQQGGLAATARAGDEQGLPARNIESLHHEREGLAARPSEADASHGNSRGGGFGAARGGGSRSIGRSAAQPVSRRAQMSPFRSMRGAARSTW